MEVGTLGEGAAITIYKKMPLASAGLIKSLLKKERAYGIRKPYEYRMVHLSINKSPPPLHSHGHQSGLKTVGNRQSVSRQVAAAAATARLHEAASKGDLEGVKAALAEGADVDAKDKVGRGRRWNIGGLHRVHEDAAGLLPISQADVIDDVTLCAQDGVAALMLANRFTHEEAQSDVVNDYPLCVQDGMAALVLADHFAHEEAQADVVFV